MRSACCAWSRTAAEPALPMSGHAVSSAARPDWDAVLVDIVDYVRTYPADSPLALDTARYCLIDTLGCGLEALEYPACTKLLGPVVPCAPFSTRAKVPVTSFQQNRNAHVLTPGTTALYLCR